MNSCLHIFAIIQDVSCTIYMYLNDPFPHINADTCSYIRMYITHTHTHIHTHIHIYVYTITSHTCYIHAPVILSLPSYVHASIYVDPVEGTKQQGQYSIHIYQSGNS